MDSITYICVGSHHWSAADSAEEAFALWVAKTEGAAMNADWKVVRCVQSDPSQRAWVDGMGGIQGAASAKECLVNAEQTMRVAESKLDEALQMLASLKAAAEGRLADVSQALPSQKVLDGIDASSNMLGHAIDRMDLTTLWTV